MLVERARRNGQGEEGWREEWEKAVDELVDRSEGWRCVRSLHLPSLMPLSSRWRHSWPKFWRMTLHTLRNLEVSLGVLEERAAESRWPLIPPDARPPTSFVLDKASPSLPNHGTVRRADRAVPQVRPLVLDFRQGHEEVWRRLPGLEQVLASVDAELGRLARVVETVERGEGAAEAG